MKGREKQHEERSEGLGGRGSAGEGCCYGDQVEWVAWPRLSSLVSVGTEALGVSWEGKWAGLCPFKRSKQQQMSKARQSVPTCGRWRERGNVKLVCTCLFLEVVRIGGYYKHHECREEPSSSFNTI